MEEGSKEKGKIFLLLKHIYIAPPIQNRSNQSPFDTAHSQNSYEDPIFNWLQWKRVKYLTMHIKYAFIHRH